MSKSANTTEVNEMKRQGEMKSLAAEIAKSVGGSRDGASKNIGEHRNAQMMNGIIAIAKDNSKATKELLALTTRSVSNIESVIASMNRRMDLQDQSTKALSDEAKKRMNMKSPNDASVKILSRISASLESNPYEEDPGLAMAQAQLERLDMINGTLINQTKVMKSWGDKLNDAMEDFKPGFGLLASLGALIAMNSGEAGMDYLTKRGGRFAGKVGGKVLKAAPKVIDKVKSKASSLLDDAGKLAGKVGDSKFGKALSSFSDEVALRAMYLMDDAGTVIAKASDKILSTKFATKLMDIGSDIGMSAMKFLKGGKSLMKGGGKTLTKILGKTGLAAMKSVPFLGTVIGAYMAFQKFRDGDLFGGSLEIASALLDLIPGVGWMFSLPLDLFILARDIGMDKEQKDLMKKKNGKVGSAIGNFGLAALKSVPFLGTVIGAYMAFKKFKSGDMIGGGLEMVSALADLIPGAGAILSIPVDILIAARDTGLDSGKDILSFPKKDTTKKDFDIYSVPLIGHAFRAYDAYKEFVGGGIAKSLGFMGGIVESLIPGGGAPFEVMKSAVEFMSNNKVGDIINKSVKTVSDFVSGKSFEDVLKELTGGITDFMSGLGNGFQNLFGAFGDAKAKVMGVLGLVNSSVTQQKLIDQGIVNGNIGRSDTINKDKWGEVEQLGMEELSDLSQSDDLAKKDLAKVREIFSENYGTSTSFMSSIKGTKEYTKRANKFNDVASGKKGKKVGKYDSNYDYKSKDGYSYPGLVFHKNEGVLMNGMNPQFRNKLEMLADLYLMKTKNPLRINSGFRPNGAKNSKGSHGGGYAVDIQSKDLDYADGMGWLAQAGMHRPLLNWTQEGGLLDEPWHLEPYPGKKAYGAGRNVLSDYRMALMRDSEERPEIGGETPTSIANMKAKSEIQHQPRQQVSSKPDAMKLDDETIAKLAKAMASAFVEALPKDRVGNPMISISGRS